MSNKCFLIDGIQELINGNGSNRKRQIASFAVIKSGREGSSGRTAWSLCHQTFLLSLDAEYDMVLCP